MKLIIINRKTWEQHHSEFADFITVSEQLIGNPPRNGRMARQRSRVQAFGHQQAAYPDNHTEMTGKIPFSMIGPQCYYKESDITELLNANNE